MDPLRISAVSEAATGLTLVVLPNLVVRLLFGAETAGAGVAMARIAGFALVALGIACWPDAGGSGLRRTRMAMLVYGALAAVYLGFLAVSGELIGRLLWPAVVVHLVVTVLLARVPVGRAAP
jgi:hypothetical protein